MTTEITFDNITYIYLLSGGSKGGQGRGLSSRSKFFNFRTVFGIKLQNNPGSVTDICCHILAVFSFINSIYIINSSCL